MYNCLSGLRTILLFISISFASVYDEIEKAFNSVEMPVGMNDYLTQLFESFNLGHLTLAGLIYPIIGIHIGKLYIKWRWGNKNINQVRKQIDTLNEIVKKLENKNGDKKTS